MHFRPIVVGLLLSLCGCAGMGPEDNRRFQAEVARQVSVGMSLGKATQRLADSGFSCDARSAAPAVTCTRDKDNILLYTCVQRANLTVDSGKGTVVVVEPMAIRCAGL